MALNTKVVKVSDMAEKNVAFKLGADRAAFKRVKYIRPFVMRFTFFIYDFYGFVGTANFVWDMRKLQQLIVLKNYDTNKVTMVRHLNQPEVQGFFGVSI